MPVIEFWLSRREETLALLGQHVVLVVAATLIAVGIGVPLGLLAARRPRLGTPLVALANVVQTIPSLAIFGFLIPLPLVGGIGARTALVALVLYGLLPLIRTTMAGIGGIPPSIVEAGRALGMTPRQLRWQVEVPLALPQIVAGIRVAAVTGVGTATIAAAIGAGGLGDYIFRGLAMVNPVVILAGAVPAALLALAVDGGLTLVERQLAARRRPRRRAAVAAAVAALAVLAAAGIGLAARQSAAIVVGSKNFTEQVILGELLAQAIERGTSRRVERKLNLGGTFICDRALAAGEIDVYVEYTGTALTAIFNEPVGRDRADVLARVRDAYLRTGRTVLEPLGFNNTFAILVRGADARRLGLRTISDAVPHARAWRAGFGYEFLERADGYAGLARAYDLTLAAPPRVMDLGLSYRALASREVDVIAGDATAGLIAALDLAALEDDRGYFPPYDAVPVASTATLLRHPDVRSALARLTGILSEADMRRLNAAVDVEGRDVPAVVGAFLAENRSGEPTTRREDRR
jgi:osmoprotectant transport system permease protein